MINSIEDAAKEYLSNIPWEEGYELNYHICEFDFKAGFKAGAEWQAKQSPWISVEDKLPKEGQRVLVGFLYYYKYYDREDESRIHTDTFTYKNGAWTDDSDISYFGKYVSKEDIKVICWLPIPSFDEILEANKDVLLRMKENGD